jgi:choline dehydrogenase-like flavoprotein
MMHPLITSAAKVHFKKPVPLINRAFFREQTICLRHPQKPGEPYVPVSAPAVDPAEVLNYSVFNAWGVLMAKPETLIAENSGHFRVILRFNPAGDEAYVNINWEQIPNEASVVTLDTSRTDPVFGLPSSYVDWRLTDADKHTARTALKLVEEYLRPHGLDAYEYVTDLSGGAEDWTCIPHEGAMTTGDHHMGAIRMSATPETGLVNPDGRLHSVDNLYVSGTAVFPTGGWANPTLTLIALAIRLADHLKTR